MAHVVHLIAVGRARPVWAFVFVRVRVPTWLYRLRGAGGAAARRSDSAWAWGSLKCWSMMAPGSRPSADVSWLARCGGRPVATQGDHEPAHDPGSARRASHDGAALLRSGDGLDQGRADEELAELELVAPVMKTPVALSLAETTSVAAQRREGGFTTTSGAPSRPKTVL